MSDRILNMADLASHGNIAGRKAMVEIIEAGMRGSDPYYNTKKLIRIEGNRLIVGNRDFEPAGDPKAGKDEVYDLNKIRNIYVFGAGKGIQRVAKAIEDVLGDRLTGGHVVDKKGHPIDCKKIGVTLGAHPVPDEDCVRGCEKILAMTKGLTKDDLVFTLASNGVSALLTMPVPGVTIDDVSKTTYVMQIVHGAPTSDLNTIRNHIDQMKSGRISKYIQPARAVHIISVEPSSYEQLMNHNVWLHNLPDSSTFEQALYNLKKWNAWDDVPESVKDFLQKADPKWETVKADEFERFAPWRIFGVMPGFQQTAKLPPAMKKAEELGFKAVILSEDVWSVESRQAGGYAAAIAKTIERSGRPWEPPVVFFSSGEMVTTVGNEKGIGGRNQEFALAASLFIAGSKNIVVGSVDTDGTDGPGIQFAEGMEGMPACLAGGIVDGYTVEEAKKAGIDLVEELKHHNASVPLWKLKSGVSATPNISLIDLTAVMVMGRSGQVVK